MARIVPLAAVVVAAGRRTDAVAPPVVGTEAAAGAGTISALGPSSGNRCCGVCPGLSGTQPQFANANRAMRRTRSDDSK
jgi:hypothetical protein